MQSSAFTRAFALLAAGAVAAAPAAAQVTVSGSTLGCFGIGCSPAANSSYTIGSSGASIAFAGASFTGLTNPFTNGFTVGNFGTFTLNGLSGSTPNTNFTTPFTLLFQLTAPGGASTPSSTLTVTGFVGNTNGGGDRDISYTGFAATPFTFSNGTGTIAVDGGQISPNATTISGRVTALATSTVPEPSTYALLATGVLGLVGAMARRRDTSA